jgi:hypothetical protein
MIHIFFVGGMYGHMIDYVINRFGYKNKSLHNLKPRFDGSMHHGATTHLAMHYNTIKDFDKPLERNQRTVAPFYPLIDAKFIDVVKKMSEVCPHWQLDRKILLTSQTIESSTLNLLFQYHKVASGVRNAGIKIFHEGIADTPFKGWNQNYTGFECMQRWEYREWFSIAWKKITRDWMVDVPLGSDWLVLDNKQFIENLSTHMRLIFAHCDLQWVEEAEKVIQDYGHAQQYIIDEFDLVENICHNVINQQDFYWSDLNVIAESLIQSKLRDQGYALQCNGLNQFPTSSASLANFLHKTRTN